MPEELGSTLNYLSNIKTDIYGDLKIYSGEWNFEINSNKNVYLSVAWSGWGKVSSARAATRLISTKFKEKSLDVLFFFGVAGGIDPKLMQGDVVISSKLVQHDMDARPIFNKYVIPPLNEKFLIADSKWIKWSSNILKKANLEEFGNIYSGLIATGDKFVSEKNAVNKLKADFNDLLGVEMEGASVAQVAMQEKIPWLILRVISDGANDSSQKDFEKFLKIYQKNSAKIVKEFIENIFEAPLI
tara:strand:+ start:354 stop:1082 length:729 start_codon:yes stop_codon:yes gene_type:complete